MRNEDMIETVRKKFEHMAGVLDERGRRVWARQWKLKHSDMAGKVSLLKPPVYREQRCIVKAWKKLKTHRPIIGFAYGKRAAAVRS